MIIRPNVWVHDATCSSVAESANDGSPSDMLAAAALLLKAPARMRSAQHTTSLKRLSYYRPGGSRGLIKRHSFLMRCKADAAEKGLAPRRDIPRLLFAASSVGNSALDAASIVLQHVMPSSHIRAHQGGIDMQEPSRLVLSSCDHIHSLKLWFVLS